MTSVSMTGQGVILWGGGLGDVMVIRPLLQALCEGNQPPAVYMTTASHLPQLFDELGLPVEVVRLSRSPRTAMSQIRAIGPFEWVYAGPRNTWRTKLLLNTIKARRVLRRRCDSSATFVADDIATDVAAFGFAEIRPKAYGELPLFIAPHEHDFQPPSEPYLLVHPGAKFGWQTKQWPAPHWQMFLKAVVSRGWNVQLVGTSREREYLLSLANYTRNSSAVSVRTELSLWQLEMLTADAAGVVCHNSGVMHIAIAHGRRTLVLTGSSARYWRAPYDCVANLTSGTCGLACNQYRCPIPGYRAKCIRKLTVAATLEAFDQHIAAISD